jgi:uncharacterized protein
MIDPVRFEPPISSSSEKFWEATRVKSLVLPWCLQCHAPFWYPRERCPRCLSDEIEWRPASGRGSIYAVSVMARPGHPTMSGREPYAVGLISLVEGVRMLSGVVSAEPYGLRPAEAVEVRWEAMTDGRNLPLFEVVAGGRGESS